MATSQTTSTHHAEALDSLARAIGKHRSAGPPRETARELLHYDTLGHTHLVGIDYAATRAVYYHCGKRYTIAVPFDADGPEDCGLKLATLRDEPLTTWIERWDVYWGWLHPRYR